MKGAGFIHDTVWQLERKRKQYNVYRGSWETKM